MSAVWARLETAVRRSGSAAMVTVVTVRGSAPREAGARMIVDAAGGFTGTIGGGTLEWKALAIAQRQLADPATPRFIPRRFALGPELGQCCGGQVELAFERFSAIDLPEIAGLGDRESRGAFVTELAVTELAFADAAAGNAAVGHRLVRAAPGDFAATAYENGWLIERFGEEPRRLLLFGAGHVGRALVMALAPLPFAVRWVDPRADAFPTHIPQNVEAVALDDPAAALATAPAGAFVLVMTHSHALDLELVRAALAAGRFPYVGVIGSATKRARFTRQLRDHGIAAAAIEAMVCPIGMVGFRSKLPAAIAAGTVAELLVRDEAARMAVAAPPPGAVGAAGQGA